MEDYVKSAVEQGRKKSSLERNSFSLVLALVKKNIFDVINTTIKDKVFRIKIDDDTSYVNSIDKIDGSLQSIHSKISSLDFTDPKVREELSLLNQSTNKSIITLEKTAKSIVDEISTINSFSGEKTKESQTILGKIAEEIQSLLVKIETLKPEFPSIQKIQGEVKVTSAPEIYNFDKILRQLQLMTNGLNEVKSSVQGIRIDIPEQKDIKIPSFPTSLSFQEAKGILSKLDDINLQLSSFPKRFPEITFPNHINVDNFPPQKYPLPVTNININPLRGFVKSTAVTVGTSITPLPGEVLSYRRSLIVYNNSSQTIYIGGSDVTTSNGLPVPQSSYSPPIDAGPKLIVYGISTAGSNVRVLEASNENIGG